MSSSAPSAMSSPFDSTQRANLKRCIQVLVPGMPGPVLDYAFHNCAALASITGPRAKKVATIADTEGSFRLRRMNSGNFGEISLTSPCGRRHLKNNSFGTPALLSFSQADPVGSAGSGGLRRAGRHP